MLTVREALTRAAGQFAANPLLSPTAVADATLLLMEVLAVDRAGLIAHPERRMDREAQALYQRLVERRLTFEPVQYILGRQEFYGLSLRVTRAVLIPRPETEGLVEAVLGLLPRRVELRIADVGTGSGAIAIALAKELPQASVTAIDLSAEALAVARVNAAEHGVAGRMEFVESDLFGGFAGERVFDAVVSNPPYVASGDAEGLHPQVREFEPAGALFAGIHGMDVYERLLPAAAERLRPGGLLALEFGFGQRDALAELAAGWDALEFREDLQGVPRVLLARRPA